MKRKMTNILIILGMVVALGLGASKTISAQGVEVG